MKRKKTKSLFVKKNYPNADEMNWTWGKSKGPYQLKYAQRSS